MDHVINSLEPFYEVNLRIVADEYKSGAYEDFTECPTYKELKALVDAMNSLYEYVGWKELNIHEEFLVELARN